MRLLMAGANASERGVSQTVLRLLGKIAAQAAMTGAAAARLADAELQLGVERLLVDWQLTDPNPDRYHATLDDAAWGEVVAEPSTPHVPVAADERLLRICIDLETWAAAAELAVDRLLDADEAPLLLKLLHEVGDAPYGRALAARVLTPRTLRILTAGEGVDAALLGRTARAMGPPAIVPLLDVLAESQSRAVRRTVFDTICEFGDVAADHALSRIEDERWYVRRNILSIMGQVGHVPASLPLRRLAEDGDHRVRAQAFAIASAHPDGEAALATGLADEEPRVVLAALHHLPATLSARFVGPLLRIAEHGGDPTRRSLAVRALGRIRDVAACAALIRVASPGRSWIGRVRIHRDPTAIDAVRVLAGVGPVTGTQAVIGPPAGSGTPPCASPSRPTNEPPQPFLIALGRALSAMQLYDRGHPARDQAVEAARRTLERLLRESPRPGFTLLGDVVAFDGRLVHGLRNWSIGPRLAAQHPAHRVPRAGAAGRLRGVLDTAAAALDDRPPSGADHPSIRIGLAALQHALDIDRQLASTDEDIEAMVKAEMKCDRFRLQVGGRRTRPAADRGREHRELAHAQHPRGQCLPAATAPAQGLRQYTTLHSLNVAVPPWRSRVLQADPRSGPRRRRRQRAARHRQGPARPTTSSPGPARSPKE